MAMKDIRTFPNAQILFKFCSNVSIWSDLSFVQTASLIENMSKKKTEKEQVIMANTSSMGTITSTSAWGKNGESHM